METVLGIVGLIIGIFFFVFIIKRINFLFTNFFTLGMIFVVCASLGVLAAYLLKWILLILAAILFIYWIYTKFTSKKDTDANSANNGKEVQEPLDENK